MALVSVDPPIPKEAYGTEQDLHDLMLAAAAGGTSLRGIGERPTYVSVRCLASEEHPIPDNVGRNWRHLDWGLVYPTEAAASEPRPRRPDEREVDELVALHELWLEQFQPCLRDTLGKQRRHGQQLWLDDTDLSGLNLAGRNLADSVLIGVNLDGANLAGSALHDATLVGASLRHANLRRVNLVKANLNKVRADHIQLTEANLTRCDLSDADLRGASLDRATLIKTSLDRADLRGCSLRLAKLDRLGIPDAVLGSLDAAGATGTIMPATFIWESDGRRQELDTDQLIAALRDAGAGEITAFTPRR
jgi:uncharacterized protein YjbI with pentapeptide repeats